MSAIHVGLISGTSMDGIDAVAADFAAMPPRILATVTIPFTDEVAAALSGLRAAPESLPALELARLHVRLGRAFAAAARDIIARAGLAAGDINAIGSHGQTLFHRPNGDPPVTVQLGCGQRIAADTGITTVAEFRQGDLAAGGQAAPLAPLIHQELFRHPEENRAVINLGGIANVTWLDAGGGPVRGADTGPANCFLDAWYRRHHDGPFDAGGRWAAAGTVHDGLLEALLDDPYFRRAWPKSTGIEQFSEAWLEARLAPFSGLEAADVQATLAECSARTITGDLAREGLEPDRVLVVGGGTANAHLMARLAAGIDPVPVESAAAHGVDPGFVEALLFAWLARERLAGRPVDTPPITGAARPVLLGAVYAP